MNQEFSKLMKEGSVISEVSFNSAYMLPVSTDRGNLEAGEGGSLLKTTAEKRMGTSDVLFKLIIMKQNANV